VRRGVSHRSAADQLAALLGPDTAAAGEDPRRASGCVVIRRANDGGVAVGRQRDGGALVGLSNRAGADQLAACWVQTPLLRVKIQAAPMAAPKLELSSGPPTMAVLPSPSSATDEPW
jgi:hypothetical protein